MLADSINTELKKDSNSFTLQELADLCKYTIQVEISENNISKLNPEFNLEDFLSDLLAFEKYIDNTNHDKYVSSKDKILQH